jgi:hypothetical protein
LAGVWRRGRAALCTSVKGESGGEEGEIVG